MKAFHPEQIKTIYYKQKTRLGQTSNPKFLEIYVSEEDKHVKPCQKPRIYKVLQLQ